MPLTGFIVRWALLLLVLIPLALLLLGLLYQKLGSISDLKRYPPPGQMIRVNGSSMHVRIRGEGVPGVAFESGVAASSVSWTPLQDTVAGFARTVSYDRAGFGWSQAALKARSAPETLESFHALINQIGFVSPYVLVGHSFGALLARLYAERWPGEVAGLVLIDPALLLEWSQPSTDRLRMLGRGVTLSRRGALLARIGFVRLCLAMMAGGSRTLPKLFSKLSSGRGHSVSERLVGEVRKLPQTLWPVVQSHWCRPESFVSMAQHLSILPETAALAYQANPRTSIPITVISAGSLNLEQLAEHESIAASSACGRQIIAHRSGHWVHLDQPEIVVDAIREMLATCGKASNTPPPPSR